MPGGWELAQSEFSGQRRAERWAQTDRASRPWALRAASVWAACRQECPLSGTPVGVAGPRAPCFRKECQIGGWRGAPSLLG